MDRRTIFSECRNYRYTLWREWSGGEGYAMFIGLNPSTADEINDDPTVRRCINYAKDWGYGALCMTNIFAFRATDPEVMRAQSAPIGKDNNDHLLAVAPQARVIVAAWGVHGAYLDRGKAVEALLKDRLHYLRLTKSGHPAHPLYLPRTLKPIKLIRRDPA